MIIIYHKQKKIQEVVDFSKGERLFFSESNLTKLIFVLSKSYSNELIVWCDVCYKSDLRVAFIKDIFHHKKIFASYSVSGEYVISDNIQYVDSTFLVNPSRKVRSATYLMSSDVGGINSDIINAVDGHILKTKDFDYFLCSLARVSIPLGVFCYSEPSLLSNQNRSNFITRVSRRTDFKFVAQHWKKRWLLLLLLNLIIFENKFYIGTFFISLFFKRNKIRCDVFNDVELISSAAHETIGKFVDVIIPTIGRKEHLYNVLKDLAKQSLPPVRVIVVEQNPSLGSVSELDYLKEIYPFEIRHIFTHQIGACNARNLALNYIESDWVFLADDDIRLETGFIDSFLKSVQSLGGEAFCISCLKEGEMKTYNTIHQSLHFGSGCSLVSKNIAKSIKFDIGFEHGFGEDLDFGMQIRLLGFDVTYLPKPEIIHLKAPIGGFRVKRKFPWENSEFEPKPSPTVMLYHLKYDSPKQLNLYKIYLALGYYFKSKKWNPFLFYALFIKQWNASIFWANKLKKQR